MCCDPLSSTLFNSTLLYIWAQAGERFGALGDWTKACVCLRKSMEGLEAVCGRKDSRTLDVARLLAVSTDRLYVTMRERLSYLFGYAAPTTFIPVSATFVLINVTFLILLYNN